MMSVGRRSLKYFTVACYALSVFLWGQGCDLPILTPATGNGTPYPCGVNWYVCAKSPLQGGGCCMNGDVCGGDQGPNVPVTCETGMCCAGGEGGYSVSLDGGTVRRTYHQSPR